MRNNFSNKLNDFALAKRKKFLPIFLIFILIIVYIIVSLSLPTPKIKAQKQDISALPTGGTAMVWPASTSQSALGAGNYGLIATDGNQISHPIASIAKCMVALSVIEKKPINKGEKGPILTMTAQDVSYYSADLAQNGSVVPVQLNEQLNEYQMLQALLIPSGDNIATTLADWAFGSLQGYLDYANKNAADWKMTQTHFADASGLSPQTVSSASDLITMGEKLMANPVLAEIVSQSQITLPLAGKVNNYNTDLGTVGQASIVGIKTGNTDEAGGCLLFVTKSNLGGKETTLVGAILGAQSRNAALQATKNIILRNYPNYKIITVVKAGQTVGIYDQKWGAKVNVVAKNDLNVLVATADKISTNITLNDIKAPKNKADEVGAVSAKIGTQEVTVQLVLDNKISNPSIFWKLLHP